MKTEMTGTLDQLTSSLGRVWGTLVEGVEHRFELFTIELKEQNVRSAHVLLALHLAALALFMAFLSLNALLFVAFWESRVVVAALILVFYSSAGVFLLWRTFAGIRDAPPPFEASIGELRKDYESWRTER
jgi:uncharacterized membrane protein YqjE